MNVGSGTILTLIAALAGSLIVTGCLLIEERADLSTERLNIWAVKLDSSGAVHWGKPTTPALGTTHIDSFGTDGGYAVAAATREGVVPAGTTQSAGSAYEEFFVVRGDDYGAVPGQAFALRDDYQIYPNESAIPQRLRKRRV
jgi:hypothetical protein